jgi:hypothetical protein
MESMSLRWWVAVLVVITLASASSASADGLSPRPYDRGQRSVQIILSSVRFNSRTSFVAGAGIGYFVLPGLELSVTGEVVFRDDPSLALIAVESRYILFPVDWNLRPFVGAFYRRWLIGNGYDDLAGVAGTFGVISRHIRGAEIGIGTAVERIVSGCSRDCTRVYPIGSVRVQF